MKAHDGLYIDGAWRPAAGQDVIDVVNPVDEQVIGRVPAGTAADVDTAVRAARAAFPAWAATPPAERAARLGALRDVLVARKDEIAETVTAELGSPPAFSQNVHAAVPIAVAGSYAELAATYAFEEKAGNSTVYLEPVGVVGAITPWNYPLHQIVAKVAPALAAGCTVVLKPAEDTPLTAQLFAEAVHEAGVPAGVFNLVTGRGPVAGQALAEHPGVDLVSFTGSTAVGRQIGATAGAAVKKVALELGGKNPNVVFADACATDEGFDTAVDQALNAAFIHSGQVCSAGSRLIVEESVRERFVAELARRAARIRLGRGTEDGVECGPLVSAQQRAKVESYVASALAEGAVLRTGGRRPEPSEERPAGGYFYEPTVLDQCHREMRVVLEEVFGPVLTVETFRTEDEAVALANDTEYGLAGAVWTADAGRARRVAGRLRHGTVWINDFHPYLPQAEWGGFGKSGTGRELGPAGLAEYRETKHVYQNLAPMPVRWFKG